MIIKCFRCGKKIDTPDSSNADYVIAQDTIAREPREVLLALKHNQVTLAKRAQMEEMEPFMDIDRVEGLRRKYPDVAIADSEYDEEEIPDFQSSKKVRDLVKVKAEIRDKDIQKTGVICPDCYRDTDFVIWGVHKKK